VCVCVSDMVQDVLERCQLKPIMAFAVQVSRTKQALVVSHFTLCPSNWAAFTFIINVEYI